PAVDGGQYPIKRVVGDRITVEADVLVDGHDRLAGVLLLRPRGEPRWRETPLAAVGRQPGLPDNDVWRASFVVDALGTWEYTVCGWVDAWATWRWGLQRKHQAGQDIAVELLAGAALVDEAAARAAGPGGED